MFRIKKINLIVIAVFCFTTGVSALAHKGENHEEAKDESVDLSALELEILNKINEDYVANVKPTFQRSCMNCHSSNVEYPWYYKLPIAKKIIDEDVSEAKEHLDMTNDFPFGGHGSPAEDLEAIKNSLDQGEMPPTRYSLMHWSAKITKEDQDAIKSWITNSLEELRQLNKEN